MAKILVLGATGHLGKVVTKNLIERDYSVAALVRNPDKISFKHKNLTVQKGDVTNSNDLSSVLNGVDAVISTLGHGFRTSYPIQKETLNVLIPLMERKRIKRFITVTGAGLQVKGDPPSLIGNVSEKLLSYIDPYRMSDAKKQQKMLEGSDLDWTVVRTPIHSDKHKQNITHIGYKQPLPWQTLSRGAISEFMIECLEQSSYIKQSPIIF